MHVCLAPPGSGHRLKRPAPAVTLVLTACLLAAGCGRSDRPAGLRLVWSVAPDPPAVGPARISLHLSEPAEGRPLTGARVRLEGNMTHPGMAPVEAIAREVAPGRYQADLTLTMRGDWIVTVEAVPAEGGVLREDFALRVSAAGPVRAGG